MPKRSSKRPADVDAHTQLATAVATPELPMTGEGKNPAAVALGRKGGLKGGKARALALTKKQRIEIARKAAAARWKR